ncbi:uncharacterized protein LOC144110991 isoform X3 [Amblyomma americanum]
MSCQGMPGRASALERHVVWWLHTVLGNSRHPRPATPKNGRCLRSAAHRVSAAAKMSAVRFSRACILAGGTLVWRFELEPDPLSQLLTVPVFPRSLLLGALREAIPHKPCSCRVRADSGFPVLHAVSTEDSASCVPG